MVIKKVTIVAPNGIHARPAKELVDFIKNSGQTVTLRTPAKTVNGASMLGILTLGLKAGSEVEVSVAGDREQEVLDQVVAALETIKD